jgi:hypothetical protein
MFCAMSELRTFEELEERWQAAQPPPRDRGTVRLIVARTGPGVHATPERAEVSVERGLHGDRWEIDDRQPDYQLTIMNARVAELVAAGVRPLDAPGDNFLVDLDLSEDTLPAGTRLRLGTAIVEVTAEPHLGCKKFRERFGAGALRWVNLAETRDRRLRGLNARVIQGGQVAVGDEIAVIPR